MPVQIRKDSAAVQYIVDPVIALSKRDIARLQAELPNSPLARVRLCAHQTPDDIVQEMMLVLSKQTVIRPHKHLNKIESFHIIEGECEVILFEDDGRIRQKIALGTFSSGLCFYYRLTLPLFHTVLVKSDYVIFHETTTGPFCAEETIYAPWDFKG